MLPNIWQLQPMRDQTGNKFIYQPAMAQIVELDHNVRAGTHCSFQACKVLSSQGQPVPASIMYMKGAMFVDPSIVGQQVQCGVKIEPGNDRFSINGLKYTLKDIVPMEGQQGGYQQPVPQQTYQAPPQAVYQPQQPVQQPQPQYRPPQQTYQAPQTSAVPAAQPAMSSYPKQRADMDKRLGISMGYAKDLACAGKINLEDMKGQAIDLFIFMGEVIDGETPQLPELMQPPV